MKKRKTNIDIKENILRKLYLIDRYPISDIEKILDVPRSRIETLFILYDIIKRSQSDTQKSNKVRKKINNTCLEKYGKETYLGSADCLDKSKKTKLEKYGDENYSNPEKGKKTTLDRYGYSYNTEKYKNTCLKRYGVDNFFKTKEFQKKSRQTKLEKYGDENYINVDKYKENFINKYGVSNPSQLDTIKCKKIQTSIKNYGTKYPTQSSVVKDKVKKTMLEEYGVRSGFSLDYCKKRAKDKMIELYGVEYGLQNDKLLKNCLKHLFEKKEYIFPSGRITYIMGYENIMLDILLKKEKINEDDIATNFDCPEIPWKDKNGKTHKHIPDIYINSQNRIIEVKSKFTSQGDLLENILLKKEYAEKLGFIYQVFVIDKKTKSILYEISSN